MLPSAAGVDLSTLTKSLAGMEEVAETDEPWDFDTLLIQLQKSGEEDRPDHGGLVSPTGGDAMGSPVKGAL